MLARLASPLALALVIVGGAMMDNAAAATFTVEPTQIVLSESTGSVLLTLKNESSEELRFELSVFSWSQSPSGEMQLEPTDDIVFFPSLLTIGPGESRRVRVGSATRRESRERTYRIFVEELPPLDRQSNGIRVLTRMGIPIFLTPAKRIASATLSALELRNGTLLFTLRNDGTVHFLPGDIVVRGFEDAKVTLEETLTSWYVLAGGRREFTTSLSPDKCSAITSVSVEIRFGPDLLRERLQTPNGVCAP